MLTLPSGNPQSLRAIHNAFRNYEQPAAMRLPILLTILLSLTLITGCDSGGGDDGGGLEGGGTVSAKVAGSSFNATVVTALNTNGVLAIGANLGASSSTQEQFNLTVNNASTGTFQFGIGGAIGIYSKGSSVSNLKAYTALSGSIELDEFSSGGASGTFSFTGRTTGGESLQVTEGQFDVTF